MPTQVSQFTFPVPVRSVVPAAVLAAQAVGKGVRQQTETTLEVKGSLLKLVGYPVTIKLTAWGVDGAANVTIEASSFGFGPLVGHTVRSESEEFVRQLTYILQQWSAQGAAQPPAMPPGGGTGG